MRPHHSRLGGDACPRLSALGKEARAPRLSTNVIYVLWWCKRKNGTITLTQWRTDKHTPCSCHIKLQVAENT